MLAICGGTVYTMCGPVIERGTVLIDGSKIAAVGLNIELPAGTEIIDATGKLVLPGFIDAHSHVGVVEEIYRTEGNDGNEATDPITPHLRVIDAVNPADVAFADALSAGVTTVAVAPGSANIIGGEIAVLKTGGTIVDQMLVKRPVGIKAALGENPKRVYGGKKKSPQTRMANAAMLRQTLIETINYCEKKSPERNLKYEALRPVIEKEIPLRVHAHRADDIVTAVRIAEEFGIKIVIEHCTEGYKVADFLAARQIPAVIGPIISNRAKVELAGMSLKNAAELYRAGVKFAIMTDHPEVPVQYLALSASLTVRGGLPEAEVLKAITINAAEILGLEDRLGSLEVGKDADIVILDRDIFDTRCQVEKIFINGQKSI